MRSLDVSSRLLVVTHVSRKPHAKPGPNQLDLLRGVWRKFWHYSTTLFLEPLEIDPVPLFLSGQTICVPSPSQCVADTAECLRAAALQAKCILVLSWCRSWNIYCIRLSGWVLDVVLAYAKPCFAWLASVLQRLEPAPCLAVPPLSALAPGQLDPGA